MAHQANCPVPQGAHLSMCICRPVVAPAVANPCPECPFNRNTTPGALGGGPVETYIGQIYAPFVIACHMHIDFHDPEWKKMARYAQTPQCVGAAIMRANVGVDERMPDALPRAKPDRVRVFADMAEFAAHHLRLPIERVRRVISTAMITRLVAEQMTRAALKKSAVSVVSLRERLDALEEK